MAVNSSQKLLLTIKRLRLCSDPVFAEQFVETDEDRMELLQLNCGIVHIRAKRLLLSVAYFFSLFYPI